MRCSPFERVGGACIRPSTVGAPRVACWRVLVGVDFASLPITESSQPNEIASNISCLSFKRKEEVSELVSGKKSATFRGVHGEQVCNVLCFFSLLHLLG